MAMAPEIIIFDESTSMLDPQGKASINQEINHLHQSRDITILSITHDMEEVAQSEHVIVLNQGKIEMEGTPKEIFAHPDLLKNMQLDIPFALKFSKYLQSKGILHEDILTLDKVVDAICQLKSTD